MLGNLRDILKKNLIMNSLLDILCNRFGNMHNGNGKRMMFRLTEHIEYPYKDRNTGKQTRH